MLINVGNLCDTSNFYSSRKNNCSSIDLIFSLSLIDGQAYKVSHGVHGYFSLVISITYIRHLLYIGGGGEG